MKTKVKNNMMKIKLAVMVAMTGLMMTTPVLADTPSIDSLKLYTGTKALITAVGVGVTALIAAGAVVAVGIAAGKMLAAPEEEKSAKKKALINTIIIGVVATCISGIFTWVLSFYK